MERKNDYNKNQENSGRMAEQDKKKYFSINNKLYIVISILVFTTTLIGLFVSSRYYVSSMLSIFLEQTDHIANANTDLFEVTYLPEFTEFITSDETAEKRAEAMKSDNWKTYQEYIEENDEYSFQSIAWSHLGKVEKTYDVTDVFLAACRDNGACYYISSGINNLKEEGKILPFDVRHNARQEDRLQIRDGGSDPYDVNHTTMQVQRYTVSAARIKTEYEQEGWSYWVVCVADINSFLGQILRFAVSMFLLFVILSSISAIFGVMFLRKIITSPIIHLQHMAERFTRENTADNAAVPQDPAIRSRDELGDLSNSLFALEKNVTETQAMLSSISEEKGRMQAQLSIATDIQYGVLPNNFPQRDTYEIYAMMQPAKEVGGDLYDFFELDDTHLALVIGDVSDKGIPAALFMMNAKTLLRVHAQLNPDPSAVLAAVNNILCDTNPADMFVTAWVGILDLSTGILTAANAGHEYPMFARDGGPFEVYHDPHGMALACMPDMKYKNYEVPLHPGDRLFVYSDGATDAIDVSSVSLGLERLTEFVRQASVHQNPSDMVLAILKSLEQYSEGTYQFDDITMLSVNYTAIPHDAERKQDNEQKDPDQA